MPVTADSFLDEAPPSADAFLDESDPIEERPPERDFVELPPRPRGASGSWDDVMAAPPRTSEELAIRNFEARQQVGMGPEGEAEGIGSLLMNPLIKLPTATGQISQDALDMLQASMMRLGAPRPSAEIEAAAKELEQRASVPPTPLAQAVAGTVNVAKGIPETFTSPVGIATLGQGALPRLGQRAVSAAFGADMLHSTPEVAARMGTASVTGDLQEKIEAYGGGAIHAGFTTGVGLHAGKPTIPSEFVNTVRRVDATVPDALNKSIEAGAKVVAERKISDQAQQLETAIEKGPKDAETIRSDQGQVRETGRQPEVVQDLSRQDLQQPAPKPAEPVGAQGGAEAQVPLADRVAAMTPDEFVQATRGEFREGGFTTHALNMGKEMATPEGIAKLRELESQAKGELEAAIKAENIDALGALSAQKQFFSEALETATGASEFKASDPVKFRQMMEAKPAEPLPEPVAQKTVGEEQPKATASQAIIKNKAAAVRAADGTIYTGRWHPEAYDQLIRDKGITKEEVIKQVQNGQLEDGFITSEGKFVRREEGAAIASKANQFKPGKEGDIAFAGGLKGMESGPGKIAPVQKRTSVDKASEQALKPRAGAAEFNKLLEEYGEQLGWIQRPDAVAGIQKVKTGASTASIKADIAGRTELATARRKAIRDLGGDPTKTMPPSELAKLLPKLKERIAKYEAEQRALEQAAEVGVEGDLPAGSAPVDFLPGDAGAPKPGPAVPKLAPGEKGTGDLLKTVEEPLKLVGEKGVDVERVAAEKAAAATAKTEAAAIAAKAQPELPGTRASAFFERESEIGGLGRSSLPPTLETVRQQRAADAAQRAADAAAESGYVPDTRGKTEKMRKSAERATESPQIPEPVQERIAEAPESRYTQQSMRRVDDAVKTMSDADLATMPVESNLYVASKLEQADRRFRAGDNDGGYQIFVELEKQGTSFGQNINQFKRLAGTRPEYVATAIDKKLTKASKDPLTEAQHATAIETARKSKEADAALDKATDAWESKPTDANAAKAETALDTANAAALDLQKFVAKFEPRSTSAVIKSVLQGNLLTPISEVANLFGNMSFLPFRMGERGIAAGLDIIDSALRGKPRELSVQPLAGTAEALKGVGRGLKQIPSILIEGTGNVIKGETRAGLHPIKAWINQFSKNPEMPTTGGKITLKDRLNLAIEGTFGVPAEAMLRGLGAGDVPFKEAARARVTAEQLKLNSVPRDQWSFAQKFPELFLPKEALQQIHKDTMASVFQRESKTLNLLTNWLKGKGEVIDLLAATVAPYKLTPWNIIGEILSYNPLIAMTKTANAARTGNSRGAKLNAGKMVVGSMLTGTGIWLYKNGLLAPSLDERDEAQKARVLSQKVLPPNHINLSGLKRKMDGGDATFKAGDETVDVFRAGGLAGAMFYMTANIGRDMERGPAATDADMWKNIIRQSTLEQARFGLNQSFLSGVEGLLTAIKEGNADNYLRQWANTVGSIALPNTLNTISRAGRKYQVDAKADDFKGKIKNMAKSKLGFAGLDDYLPLKRDFWGKPMLETPEGRDAIFYHFFDISKNKQVTSDPVELELYRLWRKTGNTAVIPSLPQRTITLDKSTYALAPAQYERYAELVGENRRTIVDALVINPKFHKLSDEQKMDMLDRVYRDGMTRGKALFNREFQGKLTPKAGRSGFETP